MIEVLLVTARGCAYCPAAKQEFHKVVNEEQYKDTIVFSSINVEESHEALELNNKYGLKAVPAVLFIDDDGALLHLLTNITEETIRENVERYL